MHSIFGATLEKPYGYWLPLNISKQGSQIDFLINLLHIFIVVFFLGWLLYFGYVLWRFREGGSRGVENKRFRFPKWIEIGVVTFELFLLVYVSTPIWLKAATPPLDDPRAIHIRVVAQQFQWIFHYPGADQKFGRTRLDLVDDENYLGLDRNDESAKDDIVSLNHLHIPVERPVIAQLSSKDVIHSFFIPVLRVKQDVIPGAVISTWFEATAEGQDFEIGCAQLCGVGHTNMRGFLHVDSEASYQQWLAETAGK